MDKFRSRKARATAAMNAARRADGYDAEDIQGANRAARKIHWMISNAKCSTCGRPALECEAFYPAMKQCGDCVGSLNKKQAQRFFELVVKPTVIRD